jgi:hypothetical protein
MVDDLSKETDWEYANAPKPISTNYKQKTTANVPSLKSDFNRELLPDPLIYYEANGLTLKGPRNASWKTTECRFHGGSDSMRIKVATGAFICMNCGARGGDVVAYQMAAYCLSFLEAAKQLGAWSGGEPRKSTSGQPHCRQETR